MAHKQYSVVTRSYEALPRSKRLRARGVSYVENSRVGGTIVMGVGNGHTHDNKTTLDAQSMDADGYLYLKRRSEGADSSTTEKVKSGYADKSGHATTADDSTKWDGKKFADYLDQSLRKGDSVTFKEVIASLFRTANFVSGMNGGTGAAVYNDGDNTVMEVDKLVVRKEASFSEVVINQTTFQLGETVFSRAGCTITRVDDGGNYYRCFYDTKANNRYSGFAVGDLARCQRYDASYGDIIKYYWRQVIAVGDEEGYVDLSKRIGEYDGTGIPSVGDDLVHFGNVSNSSRQSATVISPLNGGSITVLSGINSFSLEDTDYVGLGVKRDETSGEYRAYIYGYGDMFFGDRGETPSQYIRYKNGVLEIKANITIGEDSKYGDTTLGDVFKAIAKTANLINDDEYLTPAEKRTLRQMMAELSDSEGVAEPYWAKVQHSTASGSAWYIVKEGDVSNNHSQEEWVGWWTFRSLYMESRQNVKIDIGSKNTRNINIQFALDAEGSFNAITLSGNSNVLPIKISGNDTDKLLSYEVSETSEYDIYCELYEPSSNNTLAGYYKVVGDGLEYWDGNTQYLCYKGSYPTLYAALYNVGKVDEANELKTRFTAIIDCLQFAEVYGDENSKKNTYLEEVYAEFRTDLQKALNDYFNYVEICNLNDVGYLKKVFPNAVLDSNGAVLSQLLAVKDGTGTDANIVAGIYGGGSYELNKETGLYDHDVEDDEGNVTQNGHGTLMFFAGAEGLDSVSEAKTRVYEDGHAVFNDVEATGGFKSSSGGKRIEVHSNKDGRDAGMYIYADREIAPLSENDSMEVLAASFTSERKRISDLFSAEAKTITLQSRSFSHNQSYAQESAQEEIVLGNITVDVAGGVLKIPQITGDIIISDEEGISTSASVYVDIIVNGTVIHTEGLYGRSGEQASKNFTIAAQQRPAPTGDLSITARFRYGVSEATLGIGHTFSATVTPNGNAVVDYSQYLASYFANGFALGSSATNLFAVINDGASMIMRSIADNYGINITRDGLQLRLGGGWYDATYDSSNNCLRLMPASGINN